MTNEPGGSIIICLPFLRKSGWSGRTVGCRMSVGGVWFCLGLAREFVVHAVVALCRIQGSWAVMNSCPEQAASRLKFSIQ